MHVLSITIQNSTNTVSLHRIERRSRRNRFVSMGSYIHRSLFGFDRVEVPCDRIVSPWTRENCSQALFDEPACGRPTHSLIFHVQTQSCICRETMKKRPICFNDGLLIIDEKTNSTSCSCVIFKSVGKFYSPLIDARFRIRVHNANGIHVWIIAETMVRARSMEKLQHASKHIPSQASFGWINYVSVRCLNGFYGAQCEHDLCQSIRCKNNGRCLIDEGKALC